MQEVFSIFKIWLRAFDLKYLEAYIVFFFFSICTFPILLFNHFYSYKSQN